MDTFSDIINRWDKIRHFAEDAGITPLLARQMRARNSIDSRYWEAIIAGAQARGIDGVTWQLLGRIAARKRAA